MCPYVVSVPGNRHKALLDECSASFCLSSCCLLRLFLQCAELWICCTVTSKCICCYFRFCTSSEPSTCEKMIAVFSTHTRTFKCLLSNKNIVLIVVILAHSLFFLFVLCCGGITQAGDASRLNKTGRKKVCSIMELSLGTPETEVQCRLQNWNPSQAKPSTFPNMSWHSYKVHLVPSSSVEVHQGRLQVIICASHCAQRSLQQRPQPQTVRRMLKPGCLQCLYTLHWGVFSARFSPSPDKTNRKTLQQNWSEYNIHYGPIVKARVNFSGTQ